MRKHIIAGLVALVATANVCRVLPSNMLSRKSIISVHNSYETLNNGVRYIEGIEMIHLGGGGYAHAQLSSNVISKNGKMMQELEIKRDLEIGDFPYPIRVVHLLPPKFLESQNPEDLENTIVYFNVESEDAQVKLPSGFHIILDKDNLRQYMLEWNEWQKFNAVLPKPYR